MDLCQPLKSEFKLSKPESWFKITVSIVDSDGPKMYRLRCIDRVPADMQNKMIKIFKNY